MNVGLQAVEAERHDLVEHDGRPYVRSSVRWARTLAGGRRVGSRWERSIVGEVRGPRRVKTDLLADDRSQAEHSTNSKYAYMSCHFRATLMGDEGHFGVVGGTPAKARTHAELHKRRSGSYRSSMIIDLPR